MSENTITWPYVAGLFDGEGAIRIDWGRYGTPTAGLVVSSTSQELLVAIAEFTGHGVIRASKPAKAHHSIVYRWEVDSSSSVAAVLKVLAPLLILKRERAYWAYEIASRSANKIGMETYETSGVTHPRLSAEEICRRVALADKIGQANRDGRTISPSIYSDRRYTPRLFARRDG